MTSEAQDEKAKLPNISDDLVVTKYKMASEIVNRKRNDSIQKSMIRNMTWESLWNYDFCVYDDHYPFCRSFEGDH